MARTVLAAPLTEVTAGGRRTVPPALVAVSLIAQTDAVNAQVDVVKEPQANGPSCLIRPEAGIPGSAR
jgi:hypothetical protein